MTGKEKCRMLRKVRLKIAEANGISFPTENCDYEGEDCAGTCPVCEDEVVYLEMMLQRKRLEGKTVSIPQQRYEELRFHSADTTAWEENADDWMTGTVFSGISGERQPDIQMLLLKLGRAGITDFKEVVPFASEVLQKKCGFTNQELEDLRFVMDSLGYPWKNEVRRPRRDTGIRGMMRRNRD